MKYESEIPRGKEGVGITKCYEYNFNSKVLKMKFHGGYAYCNLKTLSCMQNDPNYPQEKLKGLCARKNFLQLLFKNMI